MSLPEGSNIVVSFLRPQAQGFTFERTADGEGWPQHITLLPWFTLSAELSEEVAISVLEEVAHRNPPFPVTVGQNAQFGPKHNVPVSVIEPSKSCRKLHTDLVRTFAVNGAAFVSRAYMGKNYQPHITHNNEPQPRRGKIVQINELSFVRFLGEKICRVVRNFPLEPGVSKR